VRRVKVVRTRRLEGSVAKSTVVTAHQAPRRMCATSRQNGRMALVHGQDGRSVCQGGKGAACRRYPGSSFLIGLRMSCDSPP